eukprot:SAG31_NODE_40217_length_282_cov_0.846995_1_plen_48_part_01
MTACDTPPHKLTVLLSHVARHPTLHYPNIFDTTPVTLAGGTIFMLAYS